MKAYEFFQIRHAVKSHLTSKYDIVKYRGKIRIPEASFNKRNDKLIYEGFAKRMKENSEAMQFCIANDMFNGRDWIYDGYEDSASYYEEYRNVKRCKYEVINKELEELESFITSKGITYDNLFQKTKSGKNAPILQLYFSKRILPDTFIALDVLYDGVISRLHLEHSTDPAISEKLFSLTKYKTFCKIESSKLSFNKTGV